MSQFSVQRKARSDIDGITVVFDLAYFQKVFGLCFTSLAVFLSKSLIAFLVRHLDF